MAERRILAGGDGLWLRIEGSRAVLGLTEEAEAELGMILYVELPDPGMILDRGEVLAVVETAVFEKELRSPLHGTVLEVNGQLERNPGLIHSSPYALGWLVVMSIDHPEELDELRALEEEQHE